MPDFGYAGAILKIDLSNQEVTQLQTADYAEKFLGGRGIADRIYWDETSPEVKTFSPENCVVIMSGPLAGFPKLSASRWQICGKSPSMEPESFSYANMGGGWGVGLKHAGFDGISIKGKSTTPVYLLIQDETITFHDASHLWGKTTVDTEDLLKAELGKQAKVLSIGPAAEHLVTFSTLLASESSSGSNGFGSVMGSKYLKAIAILSGQKKNIEAADSVRLHALVEQISRIREINYVEAGEIIAGLGKRAPCYGCSTEISCTRNLYKAENGRYYKSFCQVGDVYREYSYQYYGVSKGAQVNMYAGRLCDEYGLDCVVMQPLISWLRKCFEDGVLSEDETGLPLSKIGSTEFIQKLIQMITFREGFGDILARGTLRAAKYIGKGSEKLISPHTITKASEKCDYDPRLILANALLYALEPRRPIQMLHTTSVPLIRWLRGIGGKNSVKVLQNISNEYWGSSLAMDFSTYAGKAMASKMIQDYSYMKECLVLCDIVWPIYQIRDLDKKLNCFTLESLVVSAVTGRKLDESGLRKIGERIFNLQRAILIRQGWGGREGDTLLNHLHKDPLIPVFYDPECLVPDKDGQRVSRMGAVINLEDFEKLKDEYYTLRGWDIKSGYQTRATLQRLDLGDIADDLDKRKLLG